ncbi:MAG: glycosyltransferase family 4 protein [Kiritimatiellia bacterium]|nr:glycosyltransferase family 4 protein [Kiritimatiellia bacterium]
MKVLFFCNLVPGKQGSFEDLLTALGWEFKRHGDELVLVLAGKPIPQVAESFLEAGLRWHVIPDWTADPDEVNPWAFFSPAVNLLVEEHPDVAVVHFGNELPSLAACILGRLKGVHAKWVWQQDQQMSDPGVLTAVASKIRLLSAAFDHFVAVYDGGKQSMVLRGIAEHRITVVNNSTMARSTNRTAEQVRNNLGVREKALIAVSVASLIPRKRLDFIIKAFADAGSASQNAILLVIGDGSERQSLQSLVSELKLEKAVKFLGLRNDVRDILAAGEMFVHSATAEACSYAILESMAAGIPALVTDSGAAREQISDGESGFVVERDDFETFTKLLQQLLSDADSRHKMGEAARARWHDRYRTEVSAKKYYDLYRSLAGGESEG